MVTKDTIVEYIKQNQPVKSKALMGHLGVSRQAVHKHLKNLIQDNLILKEGSTRGASYRMVKSGETTHPIQIKRSLALKGLEEDKIFQEFSVQMNLKGRLGKNAFDTARNAFTEMLNNAIDHSNSGKCKIEAHLDQYAFHFRIRDFGIGIFFSIFDKFSLSDECAAMGELLKGKTTTMKERHAGEGVFFTSKAADTLSFRSHRLKLIFDNLKSDSIVEQVRFFKGTEVCFSISKMSKRRLDDVFNQYAPEEFDFRFDRTRIQISLFGQDYVSRSEAKRLLYGLDKFKEVVIDFKDVKSIGQGFADEIFRVYQEAHPKISIITENLSPVLEKMIQHVFDNKL